MSRYRLCLSIIAALLLFAGPARAYDEVKVGRIVPLVDKNADPIRLKRDPSGRFWILNRMNGRPQGIGLDGRVTVNVNPGSKNAPLFKKVSDFGFLPDGSLVVADQGLQRVAVLSPDAAEAKAGRDWRRPKLSYSFPSGALSAIAVSPDAIIAAAYENEPWIDVFSVDGVLLHRLLPPQQDAFKKVVSLAYAPDGTLWALDGAKGIVHRFTSDRRWLGATPGLESGQQIDVDEYGFGYVTLGAGRWAEIDPKGAVSGTFGTRGKAPGALLVPTGISVRHNDVWVAESGNRRLQSFRVSNREKEIRALPGPAAFVQVRLVSTLADAADDGALLSKGGLALLKEGKGLVEWTDADGNVKNTVSRRTKGVVLKPGTLTTDSAGRVWVADKGDDTIKAVSETAVVLRSIGKKGRKEGSLRDPDSFAIRPDGSIVVVDKGRSRVQVLTADGVFLFQVGKPGKREGDIANVVGVAANNDYIALVDAARKAVLFFNANGKFAFEIANREGKTPYWSDPTDIAADEAGRFYVLDRGSKRVRMFGAHGQFLADFGASGRRLACGADHRVLIIDEKELRTYTVTPVPAAPATITTADEAGHVRLAWKAVPEASKYRVYRSTDGSGYERIGEVADVSFDDAIVVPGRKYFYSVSGVASDGTEGARVVSDETTAARRKDVSLIAIERITLQPAFTAAYKYYVDKPVGEIEILNNDDHIHRDVKISLSLKRYSDFPTETVVRYIGPGEHQTVPVTMTFNDKVLELTENTPVQMDVRVSYFDDGVEKSVTQNAPITLYSRNSISWTDKARLASFITPRDPPIVEFSRAAIRAFLPEIKGCSLGKPFAKVAVLYESLNALGIDYVADPKTPFTEASGDPSILDYVQFPRETLHRKTGDCDDTTALMAALLESIGVDTAILDTPGHIFLMANMEAADISTLGLPEERFIRYNGTYWLPIETTALGHGFAAAWQAGLNNARTADEHHKLDIIPFTTAGLRYPPVTLLDKDAATIDYPEAKVRSAVTPVLASYEKERYEAQVKELKEKIKTDPVNHMLLVQLGMAHQEGGHTDEAKKLFESLLKEDETSDVQAAAHNDLGNIAYLAGDFQKAAEHYAAAAEKDADDGGILVNRARAAWRLGKTDEAKGFLQAAESKLPEWREYAGDMPAELLPKRGDVR